MSELAKTKLEILLNDAELIADDLSDFPDRDFTEVVLRRLVAVVKRQNKFVDDVDFLIECGDIRPGFTTEHVKHDCESLAAGRDGEKDEPR